MSMHSEGREMLRGDGEENGKGDLCERKESQEEGLFGLDENESECKPGSSSIQQWPFYPQYTQFFQPTTLFSLTAAQILTHHLSPPSTITQHIHSTLLSHNFIILPPPLSTQTPTTTPEFHLKALHQTAHYDVVEILCSLGPYAKKYTVLNEQTESFRHENGLVGCGAFGEVFNGGKGGWGKGGKDRGQEDKKRKGEGESNDVQIVVKCLKYSANKPHLLRSNIQEFFLCDMMSTLSIGPRLLRPSGFDFILHKHCLQFSMQRCLPPHLATLQPDIKPSLLLMHILQLTHSDIKPLNIMYSSSYGKNVLIDYGVSALLKERWGERSKRQFAGTYEFCGEEMKRVFMGQEAMWIDMYMNDVEMARKAFTLMGRATEMLDAKGFWGNGNSNGRYVKATDVNEVISEEEGDREEESCVNEKQLLLAIKYYLYTSQHQPNLLTSQTLTTLHHPPTFTTPPYPTSLPHRPTISHPSTPCPSTPPHPPLSPQTPSPTILSLFTLLNSLLDYQKKQTLLKQSIQFASRLSEDVLYNFYKQTKMHQHKFESLRFLNSVFMMDYSEVVEGERTRNDRRKGEEGEVRFERVYAHMQGQAGNGSSLNSNSSHNNARYKPNQLYSYPNIISHSPAPTDSTNLQYILTTPHQLQKFTQPQRISLFLQFCTFWNPSYRISLERKEKVAGVFAGVMMKNGENQFMKEGDQFMKEESEFMKEEYQPQGEFVRKECRNLVRVYGWLLGCCMGGESRYYQTKQSRQYQQNQSRYQQDHSPPTSQLPLFPHHPTLPFLILKNSILLNFQYFHYLSHYLTTYITRLITLRTPNLITLIIPEIIDLLFLTRNHFITTQEKRPLFEGKMFEYWSEGVVAGVLRYTEEKVGKDNGEKGEKDNDKDQDNDNDKEKHKYQDDRQQDHYYKSKKPPLSLFTNELRRKVVMRTNQSIAQDPAYSHKITTLISTIQQQLTSCAHTAAIPQAITALTYIIHLFINPKQLRYLQDAHYQSDLVKVVVKGIRRGQYHQYHHNYNYNCNKDEFNANDGSNGRGLNIFKLLELDLSSCETQTTDNLQLFDAMVNCQPISGEFFLALRLKHAIQTHRTQSVMLITNTITRHQGCPSFNYQTITMAYPIYDSFRDMCYHSTQEREVFVARYVAILSRFFAFHEQLIRTFSGGLPRYLRPLVDCLHCLNNLNLSNACVYVKQRPLMASLISQVHIPEQNYKQDLVRMNTLMNLLPAYSLAHLTVRHRFFTQYLALLTTTPTLTTSTITHKTNELARYCSQLILKSHLLFPQLFKLWHNKKLKMLLKKETYIRHQFNPLCEMFVRFGRWGELAGIMCWFCYQDKPLLGDYFQVKSLFKVFWLASMKSSHQPQIADSIYSQLSRIRDRNCTNLNIILVYTCILSLDQPLSLTPLRWNRLLLQYYRMFQSLMIEQRNLSPLMYNTYSHQLWVLTIKHAKRMVPLGRRKHVILVRKMVKTVGVDMEFLKGETVGLMGEWMGWMGVDREGVERGERGEIGERGQWREQGDRGEWRRKSIVQRIGEKLGDKLKRMMTNAEVPDELIDPEKRKAFIKLYRKRVQVHQQTQFIHRYDMQMMDKYQIKDLTLFNVNGITSEYYDFKMQVTKPLLPSSLPLIPTCQPTTHHHHNLVKTSRSLSSTDQLPRYVPLQPSSSPFKKKHHMKIHDKIMQIKRSEEFRICEETVGVIDRILEVERGYLEGEVAMGVGGGGEDEGVGEGLGRKDRGG